jgi:alpha-L-rhamnosidase
MAVSPWRAGAITVTNSGFETPSLGTGNYEYDPSGGSWTFSGASPSGSGIVANGSGFGNPNTPAGVQAAFIQETGTITQAIPGFTVGTNYVISFLAAERLNDAQTWNVTVNGAVVASFNPGSNATSYVTYTASFTATATTETVAFVGTDLAGGDNTVFIDNVSIASSTLSPLTAGNLTCEHLPNPLGIDVTRPRLSWMMNGTGRGHRQTAYQILVASTSSNLTANIGDLWSSGTVVSSQSVLVPYNGRALTSGEACYWKVCVADENGNFTAWSPMATWSMGLLTPSAWTAQWIGMNENTNTTPAPPSPMLRKTFSIAKPVARATVYICGLGYYELDLNGSKVGNSVLDPTYTRYDYHAYYTTYDLTTNLVQGTNAIGVQLANGFYNQWVNDEWNTQTAPWHALPELRLQLMVQYTDGTTNVIVSDTSWLASSGPLVLDTTRLGEVYDARLTKTGWATTNYNASAWSNAVVRPGIAGTLLAQESEPVKVFQSVSPVKIIPVTGQAGVYTFDFGQNLVGWGQLTVSGAVGTTVKMVFGELTNLDNSVNQSNINEEVAVNQDVNLKPYFQADTYILAGTGSNEIYAPRFTYHGFRYAEVTGLPATPTTNTLVAQVVHTALNPVGNFQCSSPLLNQIETNTIWSYLGNFVGIPTDCPHREKNGWTGDAQLSCEIGLTHFDAAACYTRWLKEFGPAQLPTGELWGVLPNADWGPGSGPAWEAAVLLVPWLVYQHSGDAGILTNNYTAMKNYVNYETSVATNNIVSYGLGDWAPPSTVTPVAVTDTTYYYQSAIILAEAAALMGNTADSTTYSNLAAQIRTSFNSTFYTSSNAEYAGGTQAAQACALNQGLATANQAAAATTLAQLVGQNNNTLDAGSLGTHAMLRTLCDNGFDATALALALQTNYPSWGYQVLQGATTDWETWSGAAGTDSHNHIYFGDISGWFMEYLAGIRPGSPGYQTVIIKPEITGAIAWAQATHTSPYGVISNSWQMTAQSISLSVIIPPNSTGLIYLPTLGTAATNLVITESGTNIWTGGAPTGSDAGVVYNSTTGSGSQTYSVWNVAAGTYQFKLTIVPTPNDLIAHPGNSSVTLSWNPPGAANYQVKRATVSGGPYSVLSSTLTAPNYSDTAVTNGQTYYYVVSAVNGGVQSANSSQVAASPSANIPNYSFETPVVSGYVYTVNGGSWTFFGASPNGSGILANGSAFGNPNAPLGSQAAFIEEYGFISQTLYGLAPGQTYTLTYLAAQRSGNSESWNVMLDNTVIQTNSPGSTSYTTYTTTFTATATSHTLKFVGTDRAGGDNTVFIDNVTCAPMLNNPTNTPLVPRAPAAAPQPALTARMQNHGVFTVQLQEASELANIVETSTNLVDWTPVYTNSGLNSPTIYTNSDVTDQSRFYRVVPINQ